VPPPCGLGISTARTAGGKYEPEDIRFQILYRLFFRSDSNAARSTPSTPGALLFALTFSYACQTSHFESQTVSLKTSARSYSFFQDLTRQGQVDRTNTATDDPAPSLHFRYRSFVTTTSRSAPRNGTHTRLNTRLLPVADETRSHRTDFASQYRDAPSRVPCKSSRPGSCRLHAGHRLARNRDTHQALLPRPATRPQFRCHSRL
jgi:hypothetical protein